MTDEDQSCYGCGAINGAYVIDIVLPNGERKNAPRAWVYPQTSRGEIGFCNNCFEDENFRDLLPKDVETISWYFAEFFVEGRPRRAMELLEPLLAKWGRVPDLKTFVSEHCSWCGVRIPRHDQIPLGAQLEMGSAENALVGCAVELDVEGYVVTGIMFPAESEEKKEGSI
jgi:hypothetical protein